MRSLKGKKNGKYIVVIIVVYELLFGIDGTNVLFAPVVLCTRPETIFLS